MARRNRRLTDGFVERIDKPGCFGDGRGGSGLQLRAHAAKSGWITKSWRQAIIIDGKPTSLGIGRYPDVTLDEARIAALENRVSISRGNDPRKRTRRAQASPVAPVAAPAPIIERNIPSFAEAGEKVIELRRPGWKSSTTEQKWQTDISGFPFSTRPVDQVEKADILEYLSSIWSTRPAYGRRKLGVLKSVFKWAIAAGHRSDNPTDSVTSVLPRHVNGVKHHAALEHGEVAEALVKVDVYSNRPATRRECGLLIRLLALTGVRTGEAAGATWDEIDMDDQVWVIPGSRTKTGETHRVPLSLGARLVLAEARERNPGSEIVFPARNNGPISASATGAMLKNSGVQATVHGFRSSFRSWAAEQGVSHEVGEACLGHRTGNSVSQAYQRSDLLSQRRKILSAWSEYVTP